VVIRCEWRRWRTAAAMQVDRKAKEDKRLRERKEEARQEKESEEDIRHKTPKTPRHLKQKTDSSSYWSRVRLKASASAP
jgi:hypothetical protein